MLGKTNLEFVAKIGVSKSALQPFGSNVILQLVRTGRRRRSLVQKREVPGASRAVLRCQRGASEQQNRLHQTQQHAADRFSERPATALRFAAAAAALPLLMH